MKISYNRLHDFVDLRDVGLDARLVSEALSSVGLAVEGIESAPDDQVFDIDVTSNRPDCLNHLGVAREVAAHFRLNLRLPDFAEPPAREPAEARPARVVIEDPELCPLYSARVMTGVRVQESPDWLKQKLLAVGQRPINNIVDITNYVLLLVGHPLHAFDYSKLDEQMIIVRRARAGESLVTLDGVPRRLEPSMLAICDACKPVALAGVMGGQNSEISLGTETILLESAYFNPRSIRATSKALGLRTEASYRFERGADPELPVKALNLACQLIETVAGGRAVGPVIEENPIPHARRVLELRQKRIRQVVGLEVDSTFVTQILERLQFEILEQHDSVWTVRIPGFRVDVEMEDDLVEEVARHYGYDRIPSSYPAPRTAGAFLPTRPQEQLLLGRLRDAGFYEAVNYVFSTPVRESGFFGSETTMLPIANPLTDEDTHLRTSLLPTLVSSLRLNLNHGTRDVRLFEIGKVFIPESPTEVEKFREELRLGLVATGEFYNPYWTGWRDQFQFFHIKGIVEELLKGLGCQAELERAQDISFLHPGAAARILIDGQPAGMIGELSPKLHEEFKFLQKVLVAEIQLGRFFSEPLPEPEYVALSRFPGTDRDLSFVVDKGTEYGRIATAIKSLNVANLRNVRLIDLYQGQKLPSGKVSLTVRLTFADLTRTLTQDEVNRSVEGVSDLLKREFRAEPRA